MLKEVAVISLFWGTVFSYEVCTKDLFTKYYCKDGYYCCSSSQCCLKSFSSWGYIGSSGAGFLLMFGIIACCCFYIRRRNTPDTVVMASQTPGTTVACISTAGHGMAQLYPQASYPQPTYGQPPSNGEYPSYGQPPIYGQPQIFANQQNYEPPPSYEQINSSVTQTNKDKAVSDYEQLNLNK